MRPLSGQFRCVASVWKLALVAVSDLLFLIVVSAQDSQPSKFTVTPLQLPDAKGLVTLDYFAYDGPNHRLWVPAGNTGNVDVIDALTDHIRAIDGFPVTRVMLRGQPRLIGPSSVAIGDGVVYVGNRLIRRFVSSTPVLSSSAIASASPLSQREWLPRQMVFYLSQLPMSCGPPAAPRPSASPPPIPP